MVTKQQQLEWLAVNVKEWNSAFNFLLMSVMDVGVYAYPGDKVRHEITFNEWQQERDRMQQKVSQLAQPAPDSSWHERGEFPPAGCECEVFYGDSWVRVFVIGIDDVGDCVFTVPRFLEIDLSYDGISNKSSFRPLRTDREKAIDEMAELVSCGLVSPEMAKDFAIKMYDAGYRKVNA